MSRKKLVSTVSLRKDARFSLHTSLVRQLYHHERLGVNLIGQLSYFHCLHPEGLSDIDYRGIGVIPRFLSVMAISSTNPATGKLLKSFEALSDSEIEEKLHRAALAFKNHRDTSFQERTRLISKLAAILEDKKE